MSQPPKISDDDMLAALAQVRGLHGVPAYSSLHDVQRIMPQHPKKVVLAKLRNLVRRGVLDGCTCGCRGDFRLPGAL